MKLFAYIASRAVSERGQGALEYIAIVVGLVLLVALGFAIAGGDILDKASSFVNDVIGNAS